MSLTLEQLLAEAKAQQASDIHLCVGKTPMFRLHGEIKSSSLPEINVQVLETMVNQMLPNEEKRTMFNSTKDMDFSFSYQEGQYRANISYERGKLAVTIRIMPMRILTSEELRLPSVVDEIITKRKGLVIISGSAGCGKSTTLMHIVDRINKTRAAKIVTILIAIRRRSVFTFATA